MKKISLLILIVILSSSMLSVYGYTITWGYPNGVQVSNSADSDAKKEATIAGSLFNSQILVSGYMDKPTVNSSLCRVSTSSNGGGAWTAQSTSSIGIPSGDVYTADPVAKFISDGSVWLTCVGLSAPPPYTYGDSNQVFMDNSTNNGASFALIYNTANTCSTTSCHADDKPWITSASTGKPYFCFTRFDNFVSTTSYLAIMAKQIGGAAPAIVAAGIESGLPHEDGVVQGCTIAVNSNTGTVFVAWLYLQSDNTGVIQLSRSFDNAKTWDSPQNVVSFNRVPISTGTSMSNNCSSPYGCASGVQIADGITGFRVAEFPQMVMDTSNRLHLAYEDYSTNSLIDVKYVQITNCGTQGQSCSFSSPVNVLNDGGVARDQFLPSISYFSKNNTVDITSLDRRNDPSNVLWQPMEYHCHLSLGSCTTASQWSTSTIVSQFSDNTSANLGDYTSIGDYYQITSTPSHEAYPVWADSRQDSGTELGIWFNRSQQ